MADPRPTTTATPTASALALAAAAARRATAPAETLTLEQAAKRTWSRIADLGPLAKPGCPICGGKTGWVTKIADCGGLRGLEIVACKCTGLAQ